MADKCTPKTRLIRVWMPVSFIEQRGGRGEEVKSPFILQNISLLAPHQEGDVLISYFLQPFTGGQCQNASL